MQSDRELAAVPRERKAADRIRETGNAPDQIARSRIEEVDRALAVPVPAGPAARSDRVAVRAHRQGVDAPFVAGSDRWPEDALQAALGQPPDAKRLVVARRDQALVNRIDNESADVRAVHFRFDAQDRRGRRLPPNAGESDRGAERDTDDGRYRERAHRPQPNRRYGPTRRERVSANSTAP